MSELNITWWKNVAKMSREELVAAYADASERGQQLLEAEKMRESVIIAYSMAEATLSLDRLRLTRQGRTFVLTNTAHSVSKLRGMRLRPEHVLAIPGWGRGKYAHEVKVNLVACGVGSNCLRHAPSPETDRANGPSNWGRTEAETLSQLTRGLGRLLDETLETFDE